MPPMSSSRWASKPAEMNTISGLNACSAGNQYSLTTLRITSPPERAGTGTLTQVAVIGSGSV